MHAGPQTTPTLRRRPRHAARATCVALADMPAYPPALVDMVERTIRELPRGRLWFTYKDIRFYFGVSRATVARRLREGLVPGVLMEGDSVIEDAPVRRFDLEQLRWLLLAVRFHSRRRPDASRI